MMNTVIHGVYAITDQHLITPKKFSSKVRQALEGGAKVVQYRDKSQHHQLRFEQANNLVKLCKEFDAISIINDDIELAKSVNADGVHIGVDDDELDFARQSLGAKKIIGISCYSDISLAEQAVLDSADYVAFGSIFSSSTKPQAPVAGLDILQQAKQKFDVPIVAIGGINLNNLADVLATGVDSVAIVRGIFADDNVRMITQKYAKAFN